MKRAHVVSALDNLAKNCDAPELTIVNKPSRTVLAKMPRNVGKLVLVPETTSSKVVFDDRVGALKGKVGATNFWLLPNFTDSFFVPAWAVRGSAEQADVNVGHCARKVTLEVGTESVVVHVPVLVYTKNQSW